LYILYIVGDRTEPSVPLLVSFGVDIPPLMETLNFLWERKELISLSRLDGAVGIATSYWLDD
jgi:hypothetical protein